MKTRKLALIPVLLFGTVLISFSPNLSRSTQTSDDQINSIALVSTMIGKIFQSPLPVMDAGPFNKKTNSIAPLIIEQEILCIDGYREAVASSLKEQFNCDVYYGESLVTRPEYIEFIKTHNFPDNLNYSSIYDENKYFPKIIIPDDEKNLFNYTDGNVIGYMNNNDAAKGIITSGLCEALGTDLIAVSYSNLSVKKYGTFGRNGWIILETYIYIFDKEGKIVAEGNTKSIQLKTPGDDVADYKTQLNTLHDILPELMAKVSKKMNNN